MVVAERAGSVDVDGISAHVPVHVAVEFVSAHVPVEFVAVVIPVGVVPAVVAIGMVSTCVATVPGRIAVEGVVVVHHRATVPVASPRIPSPSATRERTKCYAGTEGERTRERDVSRRVARRHIRVAVNHGGGVVRGVADLRGGWGKDNTSL